MRENIPLLIAKKVLIFLVSVWLLSLAVFCMARLAPGDPLSAYYGERVEKMSVAEKTEARTKLGLDEPLLEQYGVWLKNALHGDFGISYKYKQPVMEVIVQRAGNTLLLGGVGFVLTFLGALGLGLLCAWYEDRWVDKLLCRLGTVMSCIPEFWLSMILILIFCVSLRWLPSSGAYAIGHADDVGDRIVHLILPMAVVLAGHLWYYAYMVRSRLSGGGALRLCADGPCHGAEPPPSAAAALSAQQPAGVFQSDGYLCAPRAGGNLHRGNGVQLSGAGRAVLRKRPLRRL